MQRRLFVLLGMVLLLTVKVVYAEDYEVCTGNCDARFQACLARITSPNDIEIAEAKAECDKAIAKCADKCRSDYQNAQQAQEKKQDDEGSQEQLDETLNGQIKIYKFEE